MQLVKPRTRRWVVTGNSPELADSSHAAQVRIALPMESPTVTRMKHQTVRTKAAGAAQEALSPKLQSTQSAVPGARARERARLVMLLDPSKRDVTVETRKTAQAQDAPSTLKNVVEKKDQRPAPPRLPQPPCAFFSSHESICAYNPALQTRVSNSIRHHRLPQYPRQMGTRSSPSALMT